MHTYVQTAQSSTYWACCLLCIGYCIFHIEGKQSGRCGAPKQHPAYRSFSDQAARSPVFSPRAIWKKSKTPFERAWRETPKPGVFLVHRRAAVGGRPFWRHKNLFTVASLGSEWQKTAHMKLILCVSSKPFCSTILVGCNACNAISASKHLPNNTCWRLACVTDLVGGSSPDAAGKERRAQKMLVSAGH
jgi:hypothetical protein